MKKEEFLLFLKDEEIKSKIRKICLEDNVELDMMKAFVNEIEPDCEGEDMKTLLDIVRNLFKTNKTKIEEQSKVIFEKEESLNTYKNQFQNTIKVYNLYLKLSDNTKKSLENIFKGKEIDEFIACGVQEDSINNLWEYIRNEVIEDKNKDIDSLKDIFNYLFSLYIIPNDYLISQDVEIGKKFDTDYYISQYPGLVVCGLLPRFQLLHPTCHYLTQIGRAHV